MKLSKIESVSVEQGILGRILDYGTIIIISSDRTKRVFLNIKNPLKFKRIFQEISN